MRRGLIAAAMLQGNVTRKKPLGQQPIFGSAFIFCFVLKGEFEPGTISLNLTIFDN